MYLLNARLQLLPEGVPGEIYIGGKGLARGYRDQPELTSERFIPHPFREGERLYRTGDIGRRGADGSILFAGRRDDQVKIRGYRVEPAEVERVLCGHPDISAAVVISKTGEDGIGMLVAYVVLSGPLKGESLQLYVRSQLPEYMVPGYFMVLDKLPLTGNGKVDRSILPEIGAGVALDTGSGYVGAGNRLEAALISIWEAVLERSPVGIRDNFFEIGGHSLRAIQIISRVHKELGVELSLEELFSHPCIEDLGILLRHREVKGGYGSIGVTATRDYYELSHGQRRLWIQSQFGEGSLAYNVAGAYQMRGALDRNSFIRSFDSLLSRHESLRTVFITVEGARTKGSSGRRNRI
jgi:acyl carrier protein